MSQTKKSNLEIMEYYDWIETQKLKHPEKHHKYVSTQEENFLQYVIYPMFYDLSPVFKTTRPFPLVLKDYSTEKPIYVIENHLYRIVFLSHHSSNSKSYWEVSVNIKVHEFCDDPINEFRIWYMKYYGKHISSKMKAMPKKFVYPKLDLYNWTSKNFCIELKNNEKDFLLFKLFDLLRHKHIPS